MPWKQFSKELLESQLCLEGDIQRATKVLGYNAEWVWANKLTPTLHMCTTEMITQFTLRVKNKSLKATILPAIADTENFSLFGVKKSLVDTSDDC